MAASPAKIVNYRFAGIIPPKLTDVTLFGPPSSGQIRLARPCRADGPSHSTIGVATMCDSLALSVRPKISLIPYGLRASGGIALRARMP